MLKFELPKEVTEYNFDTILTNSEIKQGDSFPEPKCLLYLKKTNKSGVVKMVPAMTEKNISVIVAKAKKGKSFFMKLLNKLLVLNEVVDTVIFDTEQSGYHAACALYQINQITQFKNKVRLFALRKYSQGIRLEFIEQYIGIYKPSIIFIDNIRDCITSINSEAEAISAINILNQHLEFSNTHVVTTIHENPGKETEKARGWIGTELINKAETVYRLEKEDDIFTSKPQFTRNEKFDEIRFEINENGTPILIDRVIDESF